MKATSPPLTGMTVFFVAAVMHAAAESASFTTRKTLTDGWIGLAEPLAARGVSFDLSTTHYYAGLLAGAGDKDFEWGGRADAFLKVDTAKLGLWDGGGFHVHAESRFGDSADRKTPRSGGVWPPNTGVVLPLGHPGRLEATSIYYSHRFPTATSLLIGKINAVDLLAGDPFFGGWARDRFTNLAFVAPPSGVVPPTIMGAVLSQKLDPFALTFMVFDPEDRTNDYWVDELFNEGVNLSLGVTWSGEIAGRASSVNLTGTYSTNSATAILFSSDDKAVVQTADTIYFGGPIITIDDANPRAEAVAIKDGRIIAVGKKDEVLKTKGDATQIVDLDGKTMLPGFVDPHGHVFGGGIQALSANLLAPPDGEVKDIASLQQTLRDWIAANKEAVDRIQLVVGFGYDNAQLTELRHPTREDLDEVSKVLPVLLVHQSGHQTIKDGVTVYLAGEKEGAHLSRPDERGEHAFSNFIRQATAEKNSAGHAHTAASHCCGCRIAAMLGDAMAFSSAR